MGEDKNKKKEKDKLPKKDEKKATTTKATEQHKAAAGGKKSEVAAKPTPKKKEEPAPNAKQNGTEKIRLTYFDGAGRAELSRLVMAAAGVQFEDRRVDSNQWMEIKECNGFKM